MPNSPIRAHAPMGKVFSVRERVMRYQLVGEVKAHQGKDG